MGEIVAFITMRLAPFLKKVKKDLEEIDEENNFKMLSTANHLVFDPSIGWYFIDNGNQDNRKVALI